MDPDTNNFSSTSASTAGSKPVFASSPMSPREEELTACLARDPVDLTLLRRICWQGCPSDPLRFESWMYLCGYLPTAAASREDVLARKRSEYLGYVRRSYEPVAWDSVVGATNGSDIGEDVDHSSQAVLSSSSTATAAATGGSSSTNSRRTLLDVVDEDAATMKQIRKDIPRTSGGVPFLRHRRVTRLLERTLFIWALRHPACGYVQGMNDLVLPFLYVVIMATLQRALNQQHQEQQQQQQQPPGASSSSSVTVVASSASLGTVSPIRRAVHIAAFSEAEVLSLFSLQMISTAQWFQMEADFYWMMGSFLSGIQQNFTYDQAGVHAMVAKLEAITRQVDAPVAEHLSSLGVTFPQFSFRWMNCLLLREINMSQALRLWDTYLSEETRDLSSLHVYICAALLQHWRSALLQFVDFSAVITFLQNPPTAQLTDRDLGEVISAGYLKQQLYDHAQSHLQLAPSRK